MAKRMTLMVLAVGLFFGGLFGFKAFVGSQIRAAIASAGPPVASVSTAPVARDEWVPALVSVATLRSAQSVNVTGQVDGQVTRIAFESGDEVAAGDLLVQQYVADDQARLKAVRAELRLAELEVARFEELVRDRLVSQRDLDAARSQLDRLRAEEENLIVEIGKKSIRAPFKGRLGIRQVDLGQYLEPGDPIVRLDALDRLFADFSLPQQALPRVHVGQSVLLEVDAYPQAPFRGRVLAIEPGVDTATRNLSLRAGIENADGRLRPGMFADVRIELDERRAVLLVPQAAISFSPLGESVFVVEDGADGTVVRAVAVGTGESRGDMIEVTRGLVAGQSVVTAGQMKLRDGVPVRVDNRVPVAASLDPQPEER